jgi:biopolymer transport protein ExbB/TolQ
MVDSYNAVIDFFVNGGLFIWPIAIVFAVGIAIAVERWRFLDGEREVNSKAFQDFLPLMQKGDIEQMNFFTRCNSAAVVRIMGCGLDMMKVSKQRMDVEHSMSEGMLEIVPRLEDKATYLSMLANVATLMGLLGTIIGLIGAFTAVAEADPAEKAQLLSESISVAMNTTAFGLIAAIPLLIVNALIQKKVEQIVSSLEMSAVKFLNVMTVHGHVEAGHIKDVKLVGNTVAAGNVSSSTVETGNYALSNQESTTSSEGANASFNAGVQQQNMPSLEQQPPSQGSAGDGHNNPISGPAF